MQETFEWQIKIFIICIKITATFPIAGFVFFFSSLQMIDGKILKKSDNFFKTPLKNFLKQFQKKSFCADPEQTDPEQ